MTSRVIAKTPGQLALDLPLTVLELDLPGELHLTGTRHGDEVWWDFSQPLEASIDSFNWTRWIDGRLITGVREILPSQLRDCASGPCPYSIHLDGVGRESWVRLQGTTTPFFEWSKVASVEMELYSGPPRPRLASVAMNRRGGVCTATGSRTFSADVRLDNPALVGGASVEVYASDPSVLVSRGLRVPEGEVSGTFSVTIPGGYGGTFELVAAAGGIQLHHAVSIGSMYCMPDELRFELDDFEADLGCRGCLDDLLVGARSTAVGVVDGEVWMRDDSGLVESLKHLVGDSVHDAVLGDDGTLAMVSESSVTVYTPARDQLEPVVRVVEDFEVMGVGDGGVLYGAWSPGDGALRPAVWRGGRLSTPDIGLDAATFDGPPRAGVALGTNWHTASAFLSDGREWWTPRFAQAGEVVTAVNAAGDVVGTGPRGGLPTAYLTNLEREEVTWIHGPGEPGGLATEALGLSEAGVVVVNSRKWPGAPEGVGFFSLEGEWLPIEAVLGELNDLVTVDEVIHVSAAFDLVIRGTIGGVRSTFVLRNRDAWGGDSW